jgi:putative hydrolase of the HAD superfamily
MIDQIDNIIFDYGGVIIRICYDNTIAAFSQLSGLDGHQFFTQHRQNPLFDDYETGRISSAEFRDGLRSLLQIQVSDQALDDAWNAMLLDIPPERINLLQALGTQKRIFMLSNINEIHRTACDRLFVETFGTTFSDISELFEKVYYSYEMGDRKPNVSIFQRVLAEQQIDPTRTLFIEDTLQHIEGAKQAGLHTIHLTGGLTIHDLNLLGTPQ